MILYVTFLFLVASYAVSRMQMRAHPAYVRTKRGRLFTFLVDPPTFLIVGLLVSMVGLVNRKGRKLTRNEFMRRKRAVDTILLVFAVGFWVMEGLTYFNVLPDPLDPAKTGNYFMWNGYIDLIFGQIVHTAVPTFKSIGWNLVAIVLWALQPAALWLGRSLGYGSAFFNDMDNWSRPKKK